MPRTKSTCDPGQYMGRGDGGKTLRSVGCSACGKRGVAGQSCGSGIVNGNRESSSCLKYRPPGAGQKENLGLVGTGLVHTSREQVSNTKTEGSGLIERGT